MAKNERQCEKCKRWFWAWNTGRKTCYSCDTDTQAARVTVGAINTGVIRL